jgi:hypothetical protein
MEEEMKWITLSLVVGYATLRRERKSRLFF